MADHTPKEIAEAISEVGCLHMEWGDKTQAEVEDLIRKAVIVAFVRGAQWWEWHKTGATMWPSDRNLAEAEATKKYA